MEGKQKQSSVLVLGLAMTLFRKLMVTVYCYYPKTDKIYVEVP